MRARQSQSDVFGYLLPLAGAACMLVGITWAVYKAGFDVFSYALMGAGLLLFLTIFIRVERANIQYYLHVFLYSVLVGGICVVGYLFARQYSKQVDLTKQSLHSLSEATRKYLKGLDREVTITVFLASSQPFEPIKELYNSQTDKLKWNFVDPIKNPALARQLGERVNPGDIFFQAGETRKKINALELDPQFTQMPVLAENTFTNAIIEVTRKSKPKLYFLTGHGEVGFTAQRSTEREEAPPPPSVQGLRKALEKRGIQTEELDLVRKGTVPDDATVVVIAGPHRDLFDAETAALSSFLKAGGKLLALIDPITSRLPTSFTNLRKLLNEYGVETPDDLIVDPMSGLLGVNPPVFPLLGFFDPHHPITSNLVNLTGGARSFVTGPTRPLLKGQVPPDMTFTELVKSSPESWSVSIDKLGSEIEPPPDNQRQSRTFGVAVGKQPPPAIPGVHTPQLSKNNTRLAVFGTSLLVRDDFLQGNNTAILLMFNTVNWLTESEDMIAIPPRQMEGTPIILDKGKQRVIFMIAVILLPAVLFFGGVSYSVGRRRR